MTGSIPAKTHNSSQPSENIPCPGNLWLRNDTDEHHCRHRWIVSPNAQWCQIPSQTSLVRVRLFERRLWIFLVFSGVMWDLWHQVPESSHIVFGLIMRVYIKSLQKDSWILLPNHTSIKQNIALSALFYVNKYHTLD